MSRVDIDETARAFAVDPCHNVVLEASAGTGKTSVLVRRYVNLLKAGIEPANILAITFTRKAAAEMRERIIGELRASAALSRLDRERWLSLRDRLGEIAISTIDAFCLSLLREFPLEADLDPGFDLADETEIPRLVEEALDRSMRIFTALARTDPDIALVIAQLGVTRTRAGLASLLDRRLVAWDALDRFLVRVPKGLTSREVCQSAAGRLLDVLRHAPGGLASFLKDGPHGHPRFQLFVREAGRLDAHASLTDAEVRAVLDRLALHFLTRDGEARRGNSIPPYNVSHYANEAAGRRHRQAVIAMAPEVQRIIRQFARELNGVLARGIKRMFAIALEQYRKTLESRSALDFSDVLERALDLLRRMDEFSQSRFRLESRYHHVLVDEFQDTSRAQWELVSLLIKSWGEGLGLASNPSIFIVGDRKQSIYRFRDADVSVLQEAGRYIEALRPEGGARRSISRSFRAVPELLEFVNEICGEMAAGTSRADGFTYGDADRFPPAPPIESIRGPVLGVSVADSPEACAEAVAAEVARILREDVVRDKGTGVSRQARPGDIAILFRSRTSHREFEHELERRGIPTYVYKGLGFFDADEIKDVLALLRYLAQPISELRAAAFLRSGFARVSDATLASLTGRLAGTILQGTADGDVRDPEDARVLDHLHRHIPAWLALVDRIPPADLLERLLPELAYAAEIRGPRRQQAWENLKKMRGLIRRIQNRGYATLARIADHLDALSAGDESNAVLEAIDAVNLMTVHASKGLEFPVVFLVNMARGASGVPQPVRVVADSASETPSVSIGPFVSEVDELERERELHESRRLLYVAMTRARDRLYLSSALKDGALSAGRGSLAEVLPASLKGLLVQAAATPDDRLDWPCASGRVFTWRICRQPSSTPETGQAPTTDPEIPDLLDPLPASGVLRRVPLTTWIQRPADQQVRGGAYRGDVLTGRLVHRLFQAEAQGRLNRPAEAMARELLTRAETASLTDVEDAVNAAAAAWQGLKGRADVAALLSAGRVLAEVPFSMVEADAAGEPVILRGAIDALIIEDDGDVTVVEFKTGRRLAAHERQLELYVRAAQGLFPGARVDGRLIYPD